jgi:hypothetical protein
MVIVTSCVLTDDLADPVVGGLEASSGRIVDGRSKVGGGGGGPAREGSVAVWEWSGAAGVGCGDGAAVDAEGRVLSLAILRLIQ